MVEAKTPTRGLSRTSAGIGEAPGRACYCGAAPCVLRSGCRAMQARYRKLPWGLEEVCPSSSNSCHLGSRQWSSIDRGVVKGIENAMMDLACGTVVPDWIPAVGLGGVDSTAILHKLPVSPTLAATASTRWHEARIAMLYELITIVSIMNQPSAVDHPLMVPSRSGRAGSAKLKSTPHLRLPSS